MSGFLKFGVRGVEGSWLKPKRALKGKLQDVDFESLGLKASTGRRRTLRQGGKGFRAQGFSGRDTLSRDPWSGHL